MFINMLFLHVIQLSVTYESLATQFLKLQSVCSLCVLLVALPVLIWQLHCAEVYY